MFNIITEPATKHVSVNNGGGMDTSNFNIVETNNTIHHQQTNPYIQPKLDVQGLGLDLLMNNAAKRTAGSEKSISSWRDIAREYRSKIGCVYRNTIEDGSPIDAHSVEHSICLSNSFRSSSWQSFGLMFRRGE